MICEKPLGRDAAESYETWQRVAATGVKHMCAFNYRFVPAVRLARQMIESGELGEIQHFRGAYLQEWGTTEGDIWRFQKDARGLGRARRPRRARDRPRALPGRRDRRRVRRSPPRSSPAATSTTPSSPRSRSQSGAVGTIEASRFCQGRKNHFTWEINGSKGSLAFDLERLNELQYSEGNAGFRTVLVSEADHPFWEHWWPQGHMIGWEHSFVHELHHLLTAIRDDGDVAPHGATLEDGYRAAEVCDAMLRSAESGVARDRRVPQLMADRPADRHARHEGRRARLRAPRGCATPASTCWSPTPARSAPPHGLRAGHHARGGRGGGRRRTSASLTDRGDAVGTMADAAAALARRLHARGADRRRARRGRLGQHGDRDRRDAGAAGRRAEADGLDDGRGRHARLHRRRRRRADGVGHRRRGRELDLRRGSSPTPPRRWRAWSARRRSSWASSGR